MSGQFEITYYMYPYIFIEISHSSSFKPGISRRGL
jgi:hypothetical protein